jgi:hypothetical protein
MANSSTLNVQAFLTGDSFQQTTPIGQQYPTNANAAKPGSVSLVAGNIQMFAPSVVSGKTVNGVMVLSPAGSTNTKTFSGTSGGAGFTSTFLPFIGGIAAGGSFWIASAGTEDVQIVWL